MGPWAGSGAVSTWYELCGLVVANHEPPPYSMERSEVKKERAVPSSSSKVRRLKAEKRVYVIEG